MSTKCHSAQPTDQSANGKTRNGRNGLQILKIFLDTVHPPFPWSCFINLPPGLPWNNFLRILPLRSFVGDLLLMTLLWIPKLSSTSILLLPFFCFYIKWTIWFLTLASSLLSLVLFYSCTINVFSFLFHFTSTSVRSSMTEESPILWSHLGQCIVVLDFFWLVSSTWL